MIQLNPYEASCVLNDGNGREFHCKVISATAEIKHDNIPRIEATMIVDTISHNTFGKYIPCPAPRVYQPSEFTTYLRHGVPYKAKKVVFNPPATVVLWTDGTKTVVKCDPDDSYDVTTGVALCYMKKMLGNTSRELNKALRNAKKELE